MTEEHSDMAEKRIYMADEPGYMKHWFQWSPCSACTRPKGCAPNLPGQKYPQF